MIILGLAIGVAVFAVGVYIATDRVTCDKGEYECEASEQEFTDKDGWVKRRPKNATVEQSGGDRQQRRRSSKKNDEMEGIRRN